jgi:hypothetical protein
MEANKKIVLTYKDINNQAFIQALRGLVNHKWDAMTTAYKLTRVMDAVDSESKKAFSAWESIMKTQVEFEGEGQERKPKDQDQYKKVESEFLAIEFDLGKWTKFHVNELIGYKFSPVELQSVFPILDGLEELEKEA